MEQYLTSKVWHAFRGLSEITDNDQPNMASTQKCKVLTQNLAVILRMEEDILEEFEISFPSTDHSSFISFADYKPFFQKHFVDILEKKCEGKPKLPTNFAKRITEDAVKIEKNQKGETKIAEKFEGETQIEENTEEETKKEEDAEGKTKKEENSEEETKKEENAEGETKKEEDAEGETKKEEDAEGETKKEEDAEGEAKKEEDAEGEAKKEEDAEGEAKKEEDAEGETKIEKKEKEHEETNKSNLIEDSVPPPTSATSSKSASGKKLGKKNSSSHFSFDNLPIMEGKSSFIIDEINWSKLDDLCWTLYKKHVRLLDTKKDRDSIYYIMWKIFTVYSLPFDENENSVVIDANELDYWMTRIYHFFAISLPRQSCLESDRKINFDNVLKRFDEFSDSSGHSKADLMACLHEIENEALNGVIRKGFIEVRPKKKTILTSWNTRCCVVTTKEIIFYTNGVHNEVKCCMPLCNGIRVLPIADKQNQLNRFEIVSETKKSDAFIVNVSTVQLRVQWMQDIQLARECFDKGIINWALHMALKRREESERLRNKAISEQATHDNAIKSEREARERAEMELEKFRVEMKKKIAEKEEEASVEREKMLESEKERKELNEFMNKQLQESMDERQKAIQDHQKVIEDMVSEKQRLNVQLELTKKEKDEEKADRLKLTETLTVEQELLKENQLKIKELEDLQKQLQLALDEEKKARKDEEAVRRLQTALLDEEREAKENLVELHKALEKTLGGEIAHRGELEAELRTEKERLDRICTDRNNYADQLAEATRRRVDCNKNALEIQDTAKMSMKSMPIRKMDGSHRGLGFQLAQKSIAE